MGWLTVSGVTGGALCLFSNVRAHILVDVLGVWVTPPPPTPDAGTPRDATTPDAPAPSDAQSPPDVLDAAMLRDASILRAAPIARDAVAVTDVVAPDDVAAPVDTPLVGGSCGCRAAAPTGRPRRGTSRTPRRR